ncbi:BFD-like [2Fe-2S] binding domain protein [Roseovarius albus]|uniref:BFD-like [2Fe-2S] binding domain protein n=1 Tax=Roseovarius albus TaxID=1247867 RepID=A0A1X6ZTX2_9RHOB|nr:(2Fe-2S)-binding protein [Roseovarius albus]SLN61435.1 BFD-like [2Fe-2S] binding domain protein [Roseovarius albus]
MIICHCQNITDHEINSAIDWMRASDTAALITPGKIYHALGKAADCGGCMPLFLATMRKNDNLKVPMELRGLRHGITKENQTCKVIATSSTT